jgi:hypothetical protein
MGWTRLRPELRIHLILDKLLVKLLASGKTLQLARVVESIRPTWNQRMRKKFRRPHQSFCRIHQGQQ